MFLLSLNVSTNFSTAIAYISQTATDKKKIELKRSVMGYNKQIFIPNSKPRERNQHVCHYIYLPRSCDKSIGFVKQNKIFSGPKISNMQFHHTLRTIPKQTRTRARSKISTFIFSVHETFSSCVELVFQRMHSTTNKFHSF